MSGTRGVSKRVKWTSDSGRSAYMVRVGVRKLVNRSGNLERRRDAAVWREWLEWLEWLEVARFQFDYQFVHKSPQAAI